MNTSSKPYDHKTDKTMDTGSWSPSLQNLSKEIAADPLWIIRAAANPKLTAELIAVDDLEKVKESANHLKDHPKQDLRKAIEDVLMLEDPRSGLKWLCHAGALGVVLPEIYATVRFSQESDRRHKDVWAHTKQVVFQTQRVLPVRWAALLHDIGKVQTRTITSDGKVQFLGHAEKGAAMFRKISARLDFPKKLGSEVHFLILKHLRASQYSAEWNDSAVRRFYRQAGDYLDHLLALSRGDITTARPEKRRAILKALDELCARIEELKKEEAKQPLLPSGIGNKIIAHFNLEPGRIIGKIRSFLEDKIEKNELEPRLPAEDYIHFLENHRNAWEKLTEPTD